MDTRPAAASGEGAGIAWAAALKQGRPSYMEDRYTALVGLPKAPDYSYFGIFDGHGGASIAQYAADHLLARICSSDAWPRGVANLCRQGPKWFQQAIVEGFLNLDSEMRQHFSADHGGCTATVAIVTPTHIIVANVGDSRCVLCTTDQVHPLTVDHKPSMQGERTRIEAAGGCVINAGGTYRVNGVLAVSRALGDFSLKTNLQLSPVQQPVTPEPQCHVHKRECEDACLVLCSDGVWDVMSNGDTVEYLKHNSCSDLLDRCVALGSTDNLSAIMVRLGAPGAAGELESPPAPPASCGATGYQSAVLGSQA